MQFLVNFSIPRNLVTHSKKVRFLLRLLYFQIAALCVVLICSVSSVIWCIWFRNISKLLEKISKYHLERTQTKSMESVSRNSTGLGMCELSDNLMKNKEEDSWDIDIDVSDTGKDFMFLFDLLAHTAGIVKIPNINNFIS